VLVLIGAKMLIADIYHVPVAWSLGVTVLILAGTMVLSLKIPAKGPSGTAYPFAPKKKEEEVKKKE